MKSDVSERHNWTKVQAAIGRQVQHKSGDVRESTEALRWKNALLIGLRGSGRMTHPSIQVRCTPHPSPVFWKLVQHKDLREGVCESCVDKGLRGREVKHPKEAREVKEGSVSRFMN
jgi:hypothetical protein